MNCYNHDDEMEVDTIDEPIRNVDIMDVDVDLNEADDALDEAMDVDGTDEAMDVDDEEEQ